jgi:type 1 glutamine amidotransferase
MPDDRLGRRDFMRRAGVAAGGALGGLLVRAGRAAEPPAAAPLKTVLWVGGHSHDFAAYVKVLTEALPRHVPMGIQVVKDGSFLDSPDAEGLQVILMNHCFAKAAGVLTDAQKARLLETIRGGVGVVAVHASYYSFPEWKDIREVYGATFVRHGKVDIKLDVRLVDRDHPVTKGLPEAFETHSELYESTPLAEGCRLLALAKERGKDKEHPSVWVRTHGKGRVAVILPAHWPDAYEVEAFQKLIAQAARWAAGRE